MTSTGSAAVRVLIVDADPALLGLLTEWLVAEGMVVASTGSADAANDVGPVDLVIVDMPFPRQGCQRQLDRIAAAHPATPVLAFSSSFVAHVECCGSLARALGVGCVLPQPASREALLHAVGVLLSR